MAFSQDCGQVPVTVKGVLQANYEEFVDTIIADDLVPGLFSAGIIGRKLKEKISIITKSDGIWDANRLLMDHLIDKADREMVLKLCNVMDEVEAAPKVCDFSKHLREDLNRVDFPTDCSVRRRRSSKVSTSNEATRKKPRDLHHSRVEPPKPSVDVDHADVTLLGQADDHCTEMPNIISDEYYGEQKVNIERNTLLQEIETLCEEINQLSKNPMGDAVLSSGHNELVERNSHLKQAYLEHGEWQEAVSLPWDMACLSAVEVNGVIFVGGGYTGQYGRNSDVVMLGSKYQKCCNTYYGKKLPPTPNPTCHFGLASCLDKLYLIGGMYTTWYRWFFGRLSDQVFVYDVEASKWKQTLPPLLHPRKYPGVVGIGSHIVVAGGSKQKTIPIEIINTVSPSPEWWKVKHWHHMVYPQLVVVSDQLYIGGDRIGCIESDKHHEDLKKVYSISIADLLDESKPVSARSWKTRPPIPYTSAAMACYNNQLVTIGGTMIVSIPIIGVWDLAKNGVSILTPGPTGDYEWNSVSRISHRRAGAAALNTSHGLLVVGGFSKYKMYAISCVSSLALLYIFILLYLKWPNESLYELIYIYIFIQWFTIVTSERLAFSLHNSSEYLEYVWKDL